MRLNNRKIKLGTAVHYLVDPELKDEETSWSSSYQTPIISFLTYDKVRHNLQDLSALLGTFKPITNVYSSANPETETIVLLEDSIVILGSSTIRVDKRSHRITLIPKSDKLTDLVKSAKEIGLPYEGLEYFKIFYE
ncbi:hypothetical protein HYU23_02680 [Candidatus Woesearchaeota archaeon]|nr:hypothetical protein [Candidatus Woesearchaeota archaeon]